MFVVWSVALMIALLLLKAAFGERKKVAEHSWNSPENVQSKTWAYGLAIAALAFVLIAVISAN